MMQRRVKKFDGDTAWLDWRRGGVGASDIVAIRGMSPYKSREIVFSEKVTRREVEFSSYLGNKAADAESKARAWLRDMIGDECGPIEPLCIESIGNPRYRCSLDGYAKIDGEGMIQEHKMVGASMHEYLRGCAERIKIDGMAAFIDNEFYPLNGPFVEVDSHRGRMRSFIEQIAWQQGIVGARYCKYAFLTYSAIKNIGHIGAYIFDLTEEPVRKVFKKIYRRQLMAARRFIKEVDKVRSDYAASVHKKQTEA